MHRFWGRRTSTLNLASKGQHSQHSPPFLSSDSRALPALVLIVLPLIGKSAFLHTFCNTTAPAILVQVRVPTLCLPLSAPFVPSMESFGPSRSIEVTPNSCYPRSLSTTYVTFIQLIILGCQVRLWPRNPRSLCPRAKPCWSSFFARQP